MSGSASARSCSCSARCAGAVTSRRSTRKGTRTTGLRARQPVHGPDQLFQGERLANGAVRDRRRELPDVHAPREEGHRHLRVTGAHPAGDLEPVLRSEVDVEQEKHHVLFLHVRLHVRLISRFEHAKALELEVHSAQEAHRLVVVRDDDHSMVPARHRTRSVTAYDGRRMERTVRRGEPQTYAQAVGDLWERVGSALVRLERIAESPPDLVAEDFVDELPSLQYSLHSGAELAVGIEAPRGAEALHEELVASLGEARDATAEAALAGSLIVSGAFLFTAGAVLAAWPIWSAGLGLFAGGFLLLRP